MGYQLDTAAGFFGLHIEAMLQVTEVTGSKKNPVTKHKHTLAELMAEPEQRAAVKPYRSIADLPIEE